jgi:crotonobetainyl-CoA:carnitine CoA-transferase CaiB-like acyl-CoA transferase
MSRPLEGFKVVEVAMWGYVPSCGAVLSDWGADVIKIESPAGDPIRALTLNGIKPGDYGFTFMWEIFNRGKRGVVIDIAAEGGPELIYRLTAQADVFLTNLLPPTRRKLKIDVDDIRSRNPRIVYAVGSGQGAHGDDAEKGGFDSISFWARGGVASSVTPDELAYPLAMPCGAFGDSLSGAILAGGIAAALAGRAATGNGSVVDGSLFAAGLWGMQPAIVGASLTGASQMPKPKRSDLPNPLVCTYRTGDDRYLQLSVLQGQRYWPDFCRVIGRPDLIVDPRFATDADRVANVAECIEVIGEVFAHKTLTEWKALLATQKGQWDVVQQVGEIPADAQVIANDYVQEVSYDDGRVLTMVSSPVQFDRAAAPARPAPEHGADTDAVLLELGMDMDEIIKAKLAGIVG